MPHFADGPTGSVKFVLCFAGRKTLQTYGVALPVLDSFGGNNPTVFGLRDISINPSEFEGVSGRIISISFHLPDSRTLDKSNSLEFSDSRHRLNSSAPDHVKRPPQVIFRLNPVNLTRVVFRCRVP